MWFFLCSHKELTLNISIQDTNYINEKESIQFPKMVFLVSVDKIFNTVIVTDIDSKSFKQKIFNTLKKQEGLHFIDILKQFNKS